MKTNWKRIGVIVAVITLVGAVGLASVASAQSSGDGSSWPFNLRQRVHEAVANALGISVEEYDAVEKAARQQVTERAVADGLLPQEQADRMLERMETGFGPGMMDFGRGHKGQRIEGRMGGRENSLVAVAGL